MASEGARHRLDVDALPLSGHSRGCVVFAAVHPRSVNSAVSQSVGGWVRRRTCSRARRTPAHAFACFVKGVRARGVVVRRARIVSEPVSEYIRFEYDGTFMNVAAGELVRWLPRRHTSDLALPGNDFWVFDDSIVRFGHFSGDGEYLGEEWTQAPIAAEVCASAFEAVWRRATPHEDYKV